MDGNGKIPKKGNAELWRCKQIQLETSIRNAIPKETPPIIEKFIQSSTYNNYHKLLLACAQDYYPPQMIKNIQKNIESILVTKSALFKTSLKGNTNFTQWTRNFDSPINLCLWKYRKEFLSEKSIQSIRYIIDNYFSKKEYQRIYTTKQIKSILQYFKVIDDIDDIMDDSADNLMNYDLIKDNSCQKYQTLKLKPAITKKLHMYDQSEPDKNFFFLVKLPLYGFNLSDSNLTQTFDILEKNKRYDVVLKALPSIYHAINCPMLLCFINRLANNKQEILSTYTNYITNISEYFGTLYDISTALETTKKFLASNIGIFMHKKIGLRKDDLSTFANFLGSLQNQCEEKLKKSSRSNSPDSGSEFSSGDITDDGLFSPNEDSKFTSHKKKQRERYKRFQNPPCFAQNNNKRYSTSHNRREVTEW